MAAPLSPAASLMPLTHSSATTSGTPPASPLTIHGYCDTPPDLILDRFERGDFESLRQLRGEYTLVHETADGVTIITSPVGAMHHYYALAPQAPGGFCHGRRIADILSKAGLPWRWNWQALGDLCQLENLTANATLHPDVRRVPPGSVLQFRHGQLRIDSRTLIEALADAPADPDRAVVALNEEVGRLAGAAPYLSLSGGFDSRVILSALLRQGIRPHLITTGSDDCSDVRVARAIAARFGLQHDLIRIELSEALEQGREIANITNGTKTAWHWHTYLYPRKARIPAGSSFFVGTLGEFARSYYFDRGRLGQLGDRFPEQALERFWSLKLHRHPTFQASELAGLAPAFAAELGEEGISGRAARLRHFCHGSFLPGLTRYYLEQRVPNFYANGIAMYQASSQWRSPFHNRDWLAAIWNLKASWKLGSNWHRHAIASNCPELLEFPEENGFNPQRMLRKAPPLYWTRWMRRTPYVTYDRSRDWFGNRQLQDYLWQACGSIEDLVDAATSRSILEAHAAGQDRTRSVAFLLAMARWKEVLSDAGVAAA
jgi:asparagine synthase (glutamine-hydrolysing)